LLRRHYRVVQTQFRGVTRRPAGLYLRCLCRFADCLPSDAICPTGAGSTVRGVRTLLSPRLGAAANGGDIAMADAAPADGVEDDAALPNGVPEDPRRTAARLAADAAARRAAQTAAPAGAALVAADAHAALGEDNTAASWKEAARQEARKAADPTALNR